MAGVQRILANANNAVPAASFSATSVLAATRNVFRQQTARTGNGVVALSGSYTGAASATFDLEIRPDSTGAERTSAPTFSGSGNGTMTQPTASGGTAAQTITTTLIDLGTTSTKAQAILYADVLVQAKTAGTAGNSITLNLTPAIALVSPAVGALAADLSRETQEWADQKLDFGALPLNPDGTLPAGCPRLVFGRDTSMVYRHYKRWDGDQWQYGLSPKLAADHQKGSEVHAVTGSYSATITNGTTTETYSSLLTLYDLLVALGASALVDVSTPPANDLKPGGMAAIDMPFRTAAFALPASKSRDAMLDLTGVAATSTAPTESVSVECIDDSAIGAETWSVKSKVAGALANATTGVAYAEGFVGFTIPVASITERPVSGRIGITAESYPRDAGDTTGEPDVCLYRPILGAAATNKSFTLVWTKRPDGSCDCESVAVTGKPNEDFLGIDLGETDMAAMVAGYRARLEALTNWRKTFIAANTEKTTAGELRAAEHDINLANLASTELSDCLRDIYTGADAVVKEPDWTANTAYALDAVVEPVPRNGYRYRVTVAGTSAATQPTWPTTIGNSVQDFGAPFAVTWKCVSKNVPTLWDDVLSGLNTDLTGLSTIGSATTASVPSIKASTAYALDDVVVYLDGSAKATYGRCINAGTTGTSGFGLTGSIGSIIAPSTTGPTWLIISAEEVFARKAGDAEDINSTLPLLDDPGISHEPTAFVERYAAACDEIRAIAGLQPKKSDAKSSGSGVWQDLGTDYWAVSNGDYLPVFNNVYYHSCIEESDADGNVTIVPTREFGFAVRVGCPERLKYGDSITITLGGVFIDRPYTKGDKYEIPVVSGKPLPFYGGVTGTDTLTWKVSSSTAGALANYALTLAESAYSAGGVSFTIHRGTLPFALGDRFQFAVEIGGRFRWRKDSGSWSSDTAIANSVALSDGLSAIFTGGAAPSFVSGDVHSFSVLQPNAPGNVATAHGDTWKWSGASETLTISWTSDRTIAVVGLLRHGLTSPATVSIALKNSGGSTLQTLTPTVRSGPIIAVLSTALTTVRSMTITLSSATGMSLGWVYAGQPFSTAHNAAITLRRAYALDRSGGLNPRGVLLGSGMGGEIAWSDWLLQSEFEALLALIDACKLDGDAPIVLLPNVNNPTDAVLARIDSDALDVSDVFDFQPNSTSRRRLSLTVPLAAVVQ